MEIRTLTRVTAADFESLDYGYESNEKFEVTRTESASKIVFSVEKKSITKPYCKKWPVKELPLKLYNKVIDTGYSLQAEIDNELAGLMIVEPQRWNSTLWVWDFCVSRRLRGQGTGRALIKELVCRARSHAFRAIVCEAQNTNAPAIEFYQKCGFKLEGLDLSYYTNHDVEHGEVALFMKLLLDQDND